MLVLCVICIHFHYLEADFFPHLSGFIIFLQGVPEKKLHKVYHVINFYQRVSIASYASAGIARGGMSVRHTPVLYQNKES